MHSMNRGQFSHDSIVRVDSNASSTFTLRGPAPRISNRSFDPTASGARLASNSLVEEQAKIERELDRFRRETYPMKPGLSSEVRLVLNHVHQHLFDLDLNVERVKIHCRIRDNNVSSRFRHAMGVTIKTYIESLRMDAAERLLRHRKIGVFDVAQFVGYNHLQTFYRAFQRRFGCPPSAYRRRLRIQVAS